MDEENDEWSFQKSRRGHKGRASNYEMLPKSNDSEKKDFSSVDNVNENGPERKLAKTDWRNLVGEPVIVPSNKSTRGLLQVDMSQVTIKSPDVEPPEFNFNEEQWPSVVNSTSDDATEQLVSSEWSKVVKTEPRSPIAVRHTDISLVIEGEKDEKKNSKSKKKKRHDKPLTLELSSIIDALEHSRLKTNKKSDRTTKPPIQFGTVPAVHSVNTKQTDPSATRNVLDSSAPVKMRGKERETPKKKKPSSLRKIIDKEKEERKSQGGKPIPVLVTTPQSIERSAIPQSIQQSAISQCSATPQSIQQSAISQCSATPQSIQQSATPHNRNFRDYCTHLVTDKINNLVEGLLVDLVKFQDRVYVNEPLKFKSKRRYVCGLREVKKHLALKRLKCVIIPPNLQRIQSPGGIDEIVSDIIKLCHEQQVATVFALSRRRLAHILKKKYNIGSVGIFSYAGAEDKYKRLMDQVKSATDQYRDKCRKLLKSQQEQLLKDVTIDHSQEETANIHYTLPDTIYSDSGQDPEQLSQDYEDTASDISDHSDVKVSDWKELFEDEAKTDVNNKFSWNLEAPEFYPTST